MHQPELPVAKAEQGVHVAVDHVVLVEHAEQLAEVHASTPVLVRIAPAPLAHQRRLAAGELPEHAGEVEKATCLVIVNTYFNDRGVIKTAKVRGARVQAMKKRQQGKD